MLAKPFVSVDIPVPEAVQVDVDQDVACARTKEGDVWCWQLRIRVENREVFPPEKLPLSVPAVEIALSGSAVCARSEKGQVECWSFHFRRFRPNSPYLLKPPFSYADAKPFRKYSPPGSMVSIVGSAGAFCGIYREGSVGCWRFDSSGLPKWVLNVEDAQKIAIGPHQGCALLKTGKVSCWSRSAQDSCVSEEVPQLSGVVDIAVGRNQLYILRKTGQVLARGYLPFLGAPVNRNPKEFMVVKTQGAVSAIFAKGQNFCMYKGSSESECYGEKGAFQDSKQDSLDKTNYVPGEWVGCSLLDQKNVRCCGALSEVWIPREDSPDYPGAIASFSVRTIIGGGLTLPEAGERNKILELGVRGDLLFGVPNRKSLGWGVGPLVELRTASFDTLDTAFGLSGVGSVEDGLGLGLSGGVGYSLRRHDENGQFVFGTTSIILRGSPEPINRRKYCAGCILYAIHASVYTTARFYPAQPEFNQITLGLESAPAVILTLLFEVFR